MPSKESKMLNITELSAVPSMGALLGTQGNTALLNQISRVAGNYFGSEQDRYAPQYHSFIATHIEPIRAANSSIRAAAQRMVDTDSVREIDSYDALREIPPCMMIPVLTDAPMYKLLLQGRIDGWGFKASQLEDEKEMYDRLIETNGRIEFMDDEVDEDGQFTQTFDYYSDDVDMTHDERLMFMNTREFVRKVLDETRLDPTDLDNLRG